MVVPPPPHVEHNTRHAAATKMAASFSSRGSAFLSPFAEVIWRGNERERREERKSGEESEK
jgi:hypothetical protein